LTVVDSNTIILIPLVRQDTTCVLTSNSGLRGCPRHSDTWLHLTRAAYGCNSLAKPVRASFVLQGCCHFSGSACCCSGVDCIGLHCDLQQQPTLLVGEQHCVHQSRPQQQQLVLVLLVQALGMHTGCVSHSGSPE